MEYKDPGRYIPHLLYTYHILGFPYLGFPVESLYVRGFEWYPPQTYAPRVKELITTMEGLIRPKRVLKLGGGWNL